jgi:DNA-binding NarL/FixJ family response regulator
MQHPQLLVYETDGRLAAALRPLAEEQKWLLREPRQLTACLRLFERGGPGVLVLRLSRDPERELTLLEQLSWLHPDAAVVLVADSEQARLGGLAWDLGVRCVLLPPHTRERLSEIVTSLMKAYQPEAPARGGRA